MSTIEKACVKKEKSDLQEIVDSYDIALRSMSDTSQSIMDKVCKIKEIREPEVETQDDEKSETTTSEYILIFKDIYRRIENINTTLNKINAGLGQIV